MPDVSAFAVGDEWRWREIDNLTKLESPGRTIVIAEDKGVRKALVDGVPRALTYPYVFEPSPKPWRVWPLEVGKKWTIDVDFVQPDGAAGNIKQEARVVAYEESRFRQASSWPSRSSMTGLYVSELSTDA